MYCVKSSGQVIAINRIFSYYSQPEVCTLHLFWVGWSPGMWRFKDTWGSSSPASSDNLFLFQHLMSSRFRGSDSSILVVLCSLSGGCGLVLPWQEGFFSWLEYVLLCLSEKEQQRFRSLAVEDSSKERCQLRNFHSGI